MLPKTTNNFFDLQFFTFNYNGVIIEKTATGYKWNKKEFTCLGAAVIAVQESKDALAKSIKN